MTDDAVGVDLTGQPARGRLIAIEGATGAGKTTLAVRLAQYLNAATDLDPYLANPLPVPDGVTPGTSLTALAAELAFVGLRVVQLRAAGAELANGQTLVADWAMVKTQVFPRISLPTEDAELVIAAARMWEEQLPHPDLVVYLKASPPVLLERICTRARSFEALLDEVVLSRQCELFDAVLVDRPVLTVDADDFDVFDDEHVRELAARIRASDTPATPEIEEAA